MGSIPDASFPPLSAKIQNDHSVVHISSSARCEASTRTYQEVSELADIDWDKLSFALVPTDFMYISKSLGDGIFTKGELQQFGPLQLNPCAAVLNYGQGIFEGLKASRKADGSILLFRPEENALRMRMGAERLCMPSPTVEHFVDAVKQVVLANKRWVPPLGKGSLYIRPLIMGNGSILLFRPEENALRMRMGAERLCMPSPTVEHFVDAVKQVVLANKRWVPPLGKGSLYIRPLIMGSGSILGVAPSPEYTFVIFVTPVGTYFKEGLAPINLVIELETLRAIPGGTGGVKFIGNYAPVLKAKSIANANGFNDVLYLDSVHRKYLEEASACNVFVVKGKTISTPSIRGTILPGITRKSIIEIARSQGFQVEERLIAVEELLNADEIFCTGTAVGLSSVGSITYLGKRIEFGMNGWDVSKQLYTALTSLQMGLIEDTMGWTIAVD
ncbi:hypothetical protein HPP92_008276 [Vanilla planifolia]|uniref:Branched-chain-amino-acid aminotransferase n=1 Tax=Vanilla planifolia TaxID=51239 RepID=A0A835RE10_VANPL|nr:hypothetical protein HPP92_008276 [Vanilla planifolia]